MCERQKEEERGASNSEDGSSDSETRDGSWGRRGSAVERGGESAEKRYAILHLGAWKCVARGVSARRVGLAAAGAAAFIVPV